MTVILINWQPENLENEVVKLIPLSEQHLDDLYLVASDPLIWEQHPASDRYQRDVFRVFFDEAILGKAAFLIVEKVTNKIIGSTRYYKYDKEASCIIIGFTFLARQYWGGVYNKAVKKLLLDYAFQHVNYVYFHVGATNIRSQQGTMRIGAVEAREFTSLQYGKPTLQFEYVIEKKNWLKK
jgi:RimJ/RimL family protein N-acetyltransferase